MRNQVKAAAPEMTVRSMGAGKSIFDDMVEEWGVPLSLFGGKGSSLNTEFAESIRPYTFGARTLTVLVKRWTPFQQWVGFDMTRDVSRRRAPLVGFRRACALTQRPGS